MISIIAALPVPASRASLDPQVVQLDTLPTLQKSIDRGHPLNVLLKGKRSTKTLADRVPADADLQARAGLPIPALVGQVFTPSGNTWSVITAVSSWSSVTEVNLSLP